MGLRKGLERLPWLLAVAPGDGRPLSAIIIGGGISGLSAAWYLERAAREDDLAVSTVVVEREDLPGGKIRTLDEDGYILESGPDGFLTRKPWAMTLANELGLEGDVVYPRTAGRVAASRRRATPDPSRPDGTRAREPAGRVGTPRSCPGAANCAPISNPL